jgi:hypothetical protein
MTESLSGLLWLLLLLGPLLFLQRNLHRHIQSIFLLLTRRAEIAVALFALVFFPGVLLHEGSHYLMARLLGVRTGAFSILPQPMGGGRIRLGYVETAKADWLRDALIGAAPLLAGGAFVAYAGWQQLGLLAVWEGFQAGGLSQVLNDLPDLLAQPDFWLWFYLVVAVSSTMMPSASDRRAWLPIALVIALLLGASLLAGAGPWLLDNLARPLNLVFQALVVVFGISVAVHLVLLPPVWGLHKLLSWATGLEVTS